MGDTRFAHLYGRIRDSTSRAAELRRLTDEQVVAALAAASREHDAFLANVLATEAQNRARRSLAITDHISEAVFVIDLDGRVSSVNPAAERLLGRSRDEIVGERAYDLLRPMDESGQPLPEARALDLGALASGREVALDDVSFQAGGGLVPVSYRVAPVTMEGETVSVVLTVRNITRRRAAQAALRASESRYRMLAENQWDIITASRPDGVLTYVSSAVERILGYRPEDLIGRSWKELTPAEDIPRLLEAEDHILRTGTTWTTAHRAQRIDGGLVWLESTSRAIRDPRIGTLLEILSVSVDIQEKWGREETRARLAKVVEGHGDALIARAGNGIITGWNAAAEHLFGYSVAEALGLEFEKLVPNEVREDERRIEQAVLAGEVLHEVRSRRVRKDGTTLDVLLTASPVRSETSAILGVATLERDATAQRRLEEKVHAQEHLLQKVLDEVPLRIWALDADMRITLDRGSLAATLPSLPGPNVGMKAADIVEEYPALRELYEHALRGEPGEGTIEVEGRWLRVTFQPRHGPDGSFQGICGFSIDVTALKEAELAHQRDAERLATLDAIVAAMGRVRAAPRALLHEMAGIVAERFQAQCRLYHRLDGGAGVQTVASAPEEPGSPSEDGPPDALVWRVLDRDEPSIVGVDPRDGAGSTGRRLVVPVHANEEVVGAVCVSRRPQEPPFGKDELSLLVSVAERVGVTFEMAHLYEKSMDARAEAEAAEAEAMRLSAQLEARVAARTSELLRLNRSLEAFAQTAGHDLRAPLRGVEFFAQTLAEEAAPRLLPSDVRLLEGIRREASRMRQLVDDLLRFSKARKLDLQRQPIDLSVLAREVVEELASATPGRHVQVDIEPDLEAQGDSALVRVVLWNLLGNAWKYTRNTPEPRIVFGARQTPEGLAFFVEDNGIGFDPAQAGRLFEPFVRLPSAAGIEGTGLGLAAVRDIVERHGGKVWAQGEPGRGATFSFTLP